MYNYYVYLILSENRLVITQSEIKDAGYHLMLNNNGRDANILLALCKTYCAGVQAGSELPNLGYHIKNNKLEWAM